MDTSAILTAIDEQISKLEQAKAILIGVDTSTESTAKKKVIPPPEPKHRGRPKGSGNKKALMPEPVAKAAKHTVSEPDATLLSTAKKARKTVAKKVGRPAKPAAKKLVPVPAKKTVVKAAKKAPKAKPVKKAVSAKSISAKEDAPAAATGTPPTV